MCLAITIALEGLNDASSNNETFKCSSTGNIQLKQICNMVINIDRLPFSLLQILKYYTEPHIDQ
jgi:hypothetical protein